MTKYEHTPVLLNEVLEYLDPRPGQNIVDATLGGGGYTAAILDRVKPDGKVLAIDLDKDAVENFETTLSFRASSKSSAKREPRNPLTLKKSDDKGSLHSSDALLGRDDTLEIAEFQNAVLVQGNFAHIDKIISNHKFPAPDGIVADLGLSSYELEHRGISFQTDQPLDMRFDQSQSLDAKFILNNYDENRLRKIFENFGEEKFSRQIVKKIMAVKDKGLRIKDTNELYQIIVEGLPKPVKHKADDSARRIFQALRIEVNHELENLKEFLPKAFDLLAPGGRLIVVSFHSLEDRIVKQYFVGLTKGCVCPPDFPQCICGKNPQAKILTKKPVTAAARELNHNPRSNPAKLRAIIKL